MLCSPFKDSRRFGLKYFLHIQGRKKKLWKIPAWLHVSSRAFLMPIDVRTPNPTQNLSCIVFVGSILLQNSHWSHRNKFSSQESILLRNRHWSRRNKFSSQELRAINLDSGDINRPLHWTANPSAVFRQVLRLFLFHYILTELVLYWILVQYLRVYSKGDSSARHPCNLRPLSF
jgi:hypothetical protein